MRRPLVPVSLLAGAMLIMPLGRAAEDKPPLIRLAVQATAPPPTALHYRLLPDSQDLTPGNAAMVWQEAALAERGITHEITPEEYKWAQGEVPLKDLPRPAVKKLLDRYAPALRRAQQAARRESCDWQQPPLTLQNFSDLPGSHIQSLRQIAFLLSIQCRLQLSERHFDEAIETLRTGMALARHLSQGHTLIESLVGAATANMILVRVEEWMQLPDSPNLYWPLTALPQPFVDTCPNIARELDSFYRFFPQLRELQKEPLTPRESDALIEKLFHDMAYTRDISSRKDCIVRRRLELAIIAARVYPEARQALLDRGRPVKEVDAMPMAQVAITYFLNAYDRTRDDVLKWLALPSWQALPGLRQAENELRAASGTGGDPAALLMPASSKVYAAQVRLERHVASLRCAEALRLYTAEHEGKPPAKWGDITAVPLPVDPVTGKGFDAFYRVQDGRALLDVPAVPGESTATGWRLELTTNR